MTFPCSIRSASGGSGMPWRPSGFARGIVRVLRRAERVLHPRVVVEQRQEHADAFDDGRPELRLDAHPVVLEPALHGLELRHACRPRPAAGATSSTWYGIVGALERVFEVGRPVRPRLASRPRRRATSRRCSASRHEVLALVDHDAPVAARRSARSPSAILARSLSGLMTCS